MIPEKALIHFLSNDATEKEIEQINEWLNQHEGNRQILSEWMDAYYHDYKDENAFDTDQRLDLLYKKVGSSESTLPKIAWQPSYFVRIAASVLIAAVAAIALTILNSSKEVNHDLISRNNPNGQKSIFQLGDGSIVKLNAGSSLSYPEHFRDDVRKVYLEGEAFFNIARDTEKPFIVVTGSINTTVLGTSFNISAFHDEPEIAVTVATGKVLVSHPRKKSVLLTPNQQAVYDKSSTELTQHSANLDKVLAWKDNILRFENASFMEVERKLERWYNVQISIDSTLNNCLITGQFSDESLPNVLKAISIGSGVHYNQLDDQILITGKCE